MQQQFKITVVFTINNIALIRTHKELSISQPAVASVVAADMLLLLVERGFGGLEIAAILNFQKFIGSGTSDQNNIWFDVAEGDLGA